MAPRLSAGAVQGGPSRLVWRGRSQTWSTIPPQQQRPGGSSSIRRPATLSAAYLACCTPRASTTTVITGPASTRTHTNTRCDSSLIAVLAAHRPWFSNEELCISVLKASRWNHLYLHHTESHGQCSSTRRILVQKMTRRRSRVTATENGHHRVINKNNCLSTASHPVGWMSGRPPSSDKRRTGLTRTVAVKQNQRAQAVDHQQ
uniref:(northern house mosquito) hypothetical protein n=1 Tax=Culex pipiens TaxID=7175 RepID=A0A8D8BCP1_CULPI